MSVQSVALKWGRSHTGTPAVPIQAPLRAPVPPAGGAWYRIASRVLNVVLALLALACAWPVMLVAAVLIKLSSRGPAFYSQTRLGLWGKPFRIYKLRTMYHDCERFSGPCWSAVGDSRVLPIGRFLRCTHLDELPQLWNILRGDMSLVGPRPERPEFVPHLERVIPHYRVRLSVLPGLTGLAQIHLPPDTDLDSVRRKLVLDLRYVRQRSLWLDARIVVATFRRVCLPFVNARSPMRIPAPESRNGT